MDDPKEADLTEDERERAEEELGDFLQEDKFEIAKDLGFDPDPPSGTWTDEECEKIIAEQKRRRLPGIIDTILRDRS